MTQHSFYLTIPSQDLLPKLHKFPHVSDKILLNTLMLPQVIRQDEHHTSGKNSPSIASRVIDATSETVPPSEEEADATKDFLDASRILRAHPGLVMEHYDPTTSVHTFKIAYPRRHQGDYLRLSSPSTPSLCNSSSNSSPLTPSMQTPPSGPFRRVGSVSSRERFGSPTSPDSLDRVACSTSSLASEFPKSAVPRPLRRSASEVSQRQPSMAARYMSRRLQNLPSTTLPLPSRPSSSTSSSTLDGFARGHALHVAGASPERGDTSSPASSRDLRLSDTRWSPSSSIMSSDQLLAFREFVAQRAQDALTEARSCASSPDPHHHSFADFGEDAASDCSEYGESIQSGRRYSLDEPDTLDSVDGKSTDGDLWSALSIPRASKLWDSPDNYSLLANGDTFLDLPARSSSPASQRQPGSPSSCNPHLSPLRPRFDPQPQLAECRSPATTASIEEMQDFLPNFLDLRVGVDPLGSLANEMVSGSGDLHLSLHDERLGLVLEGSAADPSLECNPRLFEGERPDLMLAKLPPVTSHVPRRVQSAAELVSSHPRHMSPLPSSHGHSQSWSRHSDLGHNYTEDCRVCHRATSAHATVCAETTRATNGPRGNDNGSGVRAKNSELAHSQGKAEPETLRRGDSYYAKRRAKDSQHLKPGLCVAVDPRSSWESLSREVGSVSQRQRAMTLHEAAAPASQRQRAMTVAASKSPAPDRLRRSATTMTSSPPTSFYHTGGRFRTLEDRAYRHPDVPHSPLYSDLDHGVSSQEACPIGPSSRELSSGHHLDDLRVPSSETGHIPAVHSRTASSGDVYSRNASPRPPVPRHVMPSSHSRNDSYPARKWPAQTHLRRPGSSLDSRPGSSFAPISPPSFQGVGLSLIDNGAFEAPRPAPEPRAYNMHDKATSPPPQRRVPGAAAAKKPLDDDGMRDSILVVAASLTGLGAFPRRVWSKRQKHSPRSADGLDRRLGSASNSESDLKSSFISMVEDEQVKPQRKGLLSFKKK